MECPRKLLYRLISEGDKDSVVRYMDRHKMTPEYFHYNYNRNLNEEKYRTDLYYPVTGAAKQGHLDIMNTLIERGFDPDIKDISIYDGDWSPIHWACRWGHLDIVKCLIKDDNVNVNFKNANKELPLSIAIEEGYTDIAKYLIESGASVSSYAVHECIRLCGPEMVEYILSKGVDVNARDSHQKTPLFKTVTSCHSDSIALLLLDAGVDVDAEDEVGSTTFLRAAQEQDIDLMRLLISRGADPNAVSRKGNTALHFALYGSCMDLDFVNEAIAYLVVELGLKCLNTRNSQGITPVAMALKTGCDKIIFELLVNYGCNITDEFDMLDDDEKDNLESYISNCKEYFKYLKQRTSQPRSLQDLASLKLRRHFGVHLESAVKELPLPAILKDLVRIQNMDYPHDLGMSGDVRINKMNDVNDYDNEDDDDDDDDDGDNDEDNDDDVVDDDDHNDDHNGGDVRFQKMGDDDVDDDYKDVDDGEDDMMVMMILVIMMMVMMIMIHEIKFLI